MRAPIGGDVGDGFGPVADEFRRNFTDRKEIGAAVAVWRDGRPIVDLWGGHRDPARTRPWMEETLVTVFSTSKGMAALAMAVAHSRNLFELDEPVASYWPEFAANGKDQITTRELLAHRAGLPVIDVPLGLEDLADPDRMGDVLAAQAPRWAPGSQQAYHAQSLGWYESQLLRRVDPDHRTLGRYFAAEVARPLGLEFYIGLPERISTDRLATFVGAGRLASLVHIRDTPWPTLSAMLNPRSTTNKAFANPKVLAMNMGRVNRRDVLQVELPSMNGTGQVRSVAKAYGVTATGGAALGLTAATIAELERETAPCFDEVLRLDAAFAFGLMKPFPVLPFGSSGRAYGHSGMGGSFAFADPDAGVGYAYGMNRAGYSMPTDPRELALRAAVYRCLG